MKLVNYTPFDTQIDRLLDEVFTGVGRQTPTFTPRSDVYEEEDRFVVETVIPGLEAKDIRIEVEGNVLKVSSERKEEAADSKRTYHNREIRLGALNRSFRLPANVDGSKVEASYKQGVLKIELPKREEAKPRQITIQTA